MPSPGFGGNLSGHVFLPETVGDERCFARRLAFRLRGLAALGALVCCSARAEQHGQPQVVADAATTRAHAMSSAFVVARGLNRPSSSRDSTRRLPHALAQRVQELDEVGGCSVGYGGARTRFYDVLVDLRSLADDQACEELLGDSAPVTRALGLACLAQLRGARSVALLRAHVGDAGAFHYLPGGCIGYASSVGGFARELLQDADRLCPTSETGTPLLTRTELLGLDLQIAADDALVHVRWAAATNAALPGHDWPTLEAAARIPRASVATTKP